MLTCRSLLAFRCLSLCFLGVTQLAHMKEDERALVDALLEDPEPPVFAGEAHHFRLLFPEGRQRGGPLELSHVPVDVDSSLEGLQLKCHCLGAAPLTFEVPPPGPRGLPRRLLCPHGAIQLCLHVDVGGTVPKALQGLVSLLPLGAPEQLP